MENTRESEVAVIGSILIDARALDEASCLLSVNDFEGRYTSAAFAVACDLCANGGVIDPLTIAAGMEKRLNENCFEWIRQAMDITPTAANVVEYCKLVIEDANRRRMARIIEAANRKIYEGSAWQEAAEQITLDLSELQSEPHELIKPGELEKAWREHIAKARQNPDYAFCKSGFPMLNRQLGGGFFKDGLYVIGARPGMGKTTFGLNLAEGIVKQNRPILFISLEMSETQIMAKRVALEINAGYTQLMNGAASDETAATAVTATRQMQNRPFYSVCKRVNVADIERIAKKINGLEAVFIDYLGLISPREETKEHSRYEQATEISADLKNLAKRLGLPVIVLAQLNREGAKEKRPQLHQLRDSGSIEQDADGVILLYRDGYFDEKETAAEWETMEFIIAKNRHGSTGTVKMLWNSATGRILKDPITALYGE